MHFNFDTPFMEAFEELNKLDESTHTDEDPYGYGPYKSPTDPTLEVGDYIKAKQYSRDDKWYPARVTRITPDFVDYTISGFGFVKNGTVVRSDKAKGAFGKLRTYLGLTEATDIEASKRFWAAAKNDQIDEVSFHAAFDDELKELGLLDMFDARGVLANNYGRILRAQEANPDSWAVRALYKFWKLRYSYGVKSASDIAAEKIAAEEKRKQEEKSKAKRDFELAAIRDHIDIEAFHKAYDEELTKLGLMDIFNAEGLLINRGTYGRIKSELETNPKSSATRALKLLWILQFDKKLPVKSYAQWEAEFSQRMDAAAEVAARKEAERKEKQQAELDARVAVAKDEWAILNEKLPTIKTLIETMAKEFAEEKKAEILPTLKTTVKLENEIEAATRGIVNFRGFSAVNAINRVNSNSYLVKVSVTLPEINEKDWHASARIKVSIDYFLGYSSHFKGGVLDRISISVEKLDEENVKSMMLSLLNEVWESVKSSLDTSWSVQRQYDKIMPKVNAAKEAQAAADTGRPVDPKFISSILDEFKKGKQKAQKEYDFWSDSTDGSAGAAQAMATHESLVEIGVALVNCNWRAVIGDREIASWKMSDSVDSLRGELQEVFDAFSPELTIEIIKD
jgi:hypothetical protein